MSAPTSTSSGHSEPEREPAATHQPSAGGRSRGPAVALALLCAAVAAGVALRFFDRSELWLDEALTVNIARLPLGDIPEALRHDGHPPLYYVLLHGWMEVVGETRGAVRALSGVLSTASLGVAWLLGRRVAGVRAACALVVLLATSPYVIRYGAEVRMYSLVMLLVLVGALATDAAARRPTPWRLAAAAMVSGLLLLTHYWAIWLLGATIIVLVATARWRSRSATAGAAERDATPSGLVATAGALAAGGVLFLPWLPSFLEQVRSTGTPWGDRVRPTAALAETLIELGGRSVLEGPILGSLLVLLVALGLFGRAVGTSRVELDLRTRGPVRAEAAVVVLTLAIGSGIAFVQGATFATRYAAVIVPLLLLVAAVGVTRLTGALPLAVVALVAVGLGLGAAGHAAWEGGRTQAGEVADAILADGAADGDVVLYCPDQLGPAVDRLLPDDLDGLAYPALTAPELVDWVDYAERSAAADPARVAGEVLERAGERPIYVVWQEGYRTLEGQCATLLATLGTARPGSSTLVIGDSVFYEPSNLTRFP